MWHEAEPGHPWSTGPPGDHLQPPAPGLTVTDSAFYFLDRESWTTHDLCQNSILLVKDEFSSVLYITEVALAACHLDPPKVESFQDGHTVLV